MKGDLMADDTECDLPAVVYVDDETFDRIALDLAQPGKPSPTIIQGAEFLKHYHTAQALTGRDTPT